jgi:hypothetical protein
MGTDREPVVDALTALGQALTAATDALQALHAAPAVAGPARERITGSRDDDDLAPVFQDADGRLHVLI